MESTKSTKRIRLIDIANRVGVSKAAVAGVLGNYKSSIRVSELTRRNIIETAERMNYISNIPAQMLAGKSSMIIGVLIDSVAPRCIYAMLGKLEELAAESGYRLMVGQTHDNVHNLFECYENFSRYGIDGVICFSHEYPGHEKELNTFFNTKNNLVYIGKPCIKKASYIEIDRTVGIRQAVEYLYSSGRRNVGLCFPESKYYDFQQRLDAFSKAVKDYGIYNQKLFTILNGTTCLLPIREQMEKYVETIALKEAIDAIITVNDVYAAHLIVALLSKGIQVPKQIAVIGHDNDDFSEFFYPTISSIDQKPTLVAQAAFETLLFKLKNSTEETKVTEIKTEFIPRQSSLESGILHGDDDHV